MADNKEVVKKQNTDLSSEISADLIIKSAGLGLENVTNDDITIPRLAIIQ